MQVFQSNKFAKTFKKLKKDEIAVLQLELEKVVNNSSVGIQKTGILARVWVYKFEHKKQQKLVAYIPKKNRITFISYGSHENFYRDLSR